jgi:hypothetical protein
MNGVLGMARLLRDTPGSTPSRPAIVDAVIGSAEALDHADQRYSRPLQNRRRALRAEPGRLRAAAFSRAAEEPSFSNRAEAKGIGFTLDLAAKPAGAGPRRSGPLAPDHHQSRRQRDQVHEPGQGAPCRVAPERAQRGRAPGPARSASATLAWASPPIVKPKSSAPLPRPMPAPRGSTAAAGSGLMIAHRLAMLMHGDVRLVQLDGSRAPSSRSDIELDQPQETALAARPCRYCRCPATDRRRATALGPGHGRARPPLANGGAGRR